MNGLRCESRSISILQRQTRLKGTFLVEGIEVYGIAEESEQTAARDSVLEELKAQREKAELAEKAKHRPHLFRDPEERERV